MSINYPCIYHKDGYCLRDPEQPDACVFGPCEDETPSNADRIRIMNDEELAKANVRQKCEWNSWECWSVYITSDGEQFGDAEEAYKHELEWLQQPAKEG